MGLRHSYTLLAPLYDAVVGSASGAMRRASLARLDPAPGRRVLLAGVGTGLDLPLLPPGPLYLGVDLTPAMLARARRRAAERDDVALVCGDAMRLPCAGACFDAVVMHLILAVVPQPERALAEAARVLKPGGRILMLDKFLRPGQRAPLRRLLSPLLARIATRTDVVFEHVLAAVPELAVREDEPVQPGGWFRRIVLDKAA